MSKKKQMTVEEALKSMRGVKKDGSENTLNQKFSKKKFNRLMLAILNDTEFVHKMAKVKGGELVDEEEIMVTRGFRRFCKKLVEKCGIDKLESEKIMSPDFIFEDVDGLYEFIAVALYKYMEVGQRFDFIPTVDFKGSITIKEIPESVKIADAFSPQDRKYLGTYETKKKKYKAITAKSECPKYLKTRKKVDKKKSDKK